MWDVSFSSVTPLPGLDLKILYHSVRPPPIIKISGAYAYNRILTSLVDAWIATPRLVANWASSRWTVSQLDYRPCFPPLNLYSSPRQSLHCCGLQCNRPHSTSPPFLVIGDHSQSVWKVEAAGNPSGDTTDTTSPTDSTGTGTGTATTSGTGSTSGSSATSKPPTSTTPGTQGSGSSGLTPTAKASGVQRTFASVGFANIFMATGILLGALSVL